MWDDLSNYYYDDVKDYSQEIMADCGFRNKSYNDFFKQLIENTLCHKIIWEPVFDKNLIWNETDGKFCCFDPIIRCKVGRRYLYAELSDKIYNTDLKKEIKSIDGLYSIINNEKKYYLLSDYPYVDYHKGLEFIFEQSYDLLSLYKAIEKVNEDFFQLFKREKAIRRINLLNMFYDLIAQRNAECDIDIKDKSCYYKKYLIVCDNYNGIYVSKESAKGFNCFRLLSSELDEMVKDAYGDISINEYDTRFNKLLEDWYFLD